MTIFNPVESVKQITLAMEKKERFGYINVPKSSIVALSKNSENPFPASFAKNILAALKKNESKLMKAISHSLVSDIEAGKHFKVGLNKKSDYYYSNVFEYYFLNNKDVYDTIINYYIRNSSKVVVSFHDKKIIQRQIGFDAHVITVPFQNYQQKVDDIYAQVSEFGNDVDYCLMDCGILGLGLTPKIWDNLSASIIDMGKVISLSKTLSQQ